MRRAAKVDRNQAEIVAALRGVGASVQPIHRVGQGVPDLLVGRGGANYLLEVKMPKEKLTPDELEWHLSWRGQVAVVYGIEDALQVVVTIGQAA